MRRNLSDSEETDLIHANQDADWEAQADGLKVVPDFTEDDDLEPCKGKGCKSGKPGVEHLRWYCSEDCFYNHYDGPGDSYYAQ